MLNKLVREGVGKPVVGGILVTGFQTQTYKMELIDIGVYRMVELSKTLFFRNIHELTLIPTIVSNLLQLKVKKFTSHYRLQSIANSKAIACHSHNS